MRAAGATPPFFVYANVADPQRRPQRIVNRLRRRVAVARTKRGWRISFVAVYAGAPDVTWPANILALIDIADAPHLTPEGETFSS
jgi:hypothetical protein